jgi:hypothetical protein
MATATATIHAFVTLETKSRPANNPYAIYRAGDMTWHVCKTYKTPASEAKDQYARWFVWAKSPMTYGSFEGGDTYAAEVTALWPPNPHGWNQCKRTGSSRTATKCQRPRNTFGRSPTRN